MTGKTCDDVFEKLDKHMGDSTERWSSAEWGARWGWGTVIVLTGILTLAEGQGWLSAEVSVATVIGTAAIIAGGLIILSATIRKLIRGH